MLIESDIITALIKKEDWLKSVAEKILVLIRNGTLQPIELSTEVFHELYYVISDYASLDDVLENFVRLAGLENIRFLRPKPETYVTAVFIMKSYNITSIFDAIYAAHILNKDGSDNVIISTDHIYDNIPGIKRIDPRTLVLKMK
ncbi:MAG: type II toxin-antitoxin system VapC family toxin [Candidatus Asgardarchaeia archaeon]